MIVRNDSDKTGFSRSVWPLGVGIHTESQRAFIIKKIVDDWQCELLVIAYCHQKKVVES